MNNALFLKVGCQNLVEVIPCIVKPKDFNFCSKLVLNHGVKVRDNTAYIRFFCLIKNIQVTLVQSSI